MVPVGIGLFLLEVVVKVVIEVVETRFFIGQRVVGRQAVVVTDVEVIVSIVVRTDDKGSLSLPNIPGCGAAPRIEVIWLPGSMAG